MKTITEFSGILLQRAAEAQQAYRAEHPQISTPAVETAPPAPVVAEESTASEDAAVTEPAAVEAAAGEETSDGAAPSGEAAPSEGGASEGDVEAQPEAAPAPDLGSGPEAEAVGAALQVQGDRLSRLMEALDVVGRRVAQVRLVRVIQGETAPAGRARGR